MRFFMLAILSIGCSETKSQDTSNGDVISDQDADGFAAEEDCDDSDPYVNPNAIEIYNGVDDDCDGNDSDQDEDGYDVDTDCDDTDPEAFPGSEDWTEDCEPVGEETGDTADTGDSEVDGGGDGEKDGGCGCTSLDLSGSSAWSLLLAGAVLLRRRRTV